MPKHKEKNTNTNALLFIAFWVSVITECVALYKKQYIVYSFSRVWVVPVLLTSILLSPVVKKVSFYSYAGLFCSLFADIFTIFGNDDIAYIGLSLYTASYLVFGCYFQQMKRNHNYSHIVFIVALLLLAAVNCLWLFVPNLRNETYYMQLALHSGILVFAVYTILDAKKRVNHPAIGLFLIAVGFMVITNVLYGLDLLYFHRKYAIMDSLVGLGDGVYLFLATKAVVSISKAGLNG
ncbi:hypothetical protein [Parasediminibacterium sp. JCM 36343]|uniref:hypothetical protein n=1 Tax=Parasediminibacterium sp. JCM 36343 TaxID=3374279 RepID=UPI00397B26F3